MGDIPLFYFGLAGIRSLLFVVFIVFVEVLLRVLVEIEYSMFPEEDLKEAP